MTNPRPLEYYHCRANLSDARGSLKVYILFLDLLGWDIPHPGLPGGYRRCPAGWRRAGFSWETTTFGEERVAALRVGLPPPSYTPFHQTWPGNTRNHGQNNNIGHIMSLSEAWYTPVCKSVLGRRVPRGTVILSKTEPEVVNIKGALPMESGGPVRYPFLSYRPARLHRLVESIPRNRFLSSLNVYKYGLSCTVWWKPFV